MRNHCLLRRPNRPEPRRRVRRAEARPRLRPKGEAGFTLIEVLITTVILGIGLVGVGSMVTYGVVSHRKSVNYTVAAARAIQEMERIRDAGFLGANVGTDLFPYPTYQILNASQVGFTPSGLKDGQGVITIAEDSQAQVTDPDTGLPYGNMKAVSVSISWGGARILSGSYTAATLIANRP